MPCLDDFLNYFTPQQAAVLTKITPELSASSMAMSPFISRSGHLFLTTVLVLFVASSATWEFIKFFTRDDVVRFSKRSATEVDPISIDVTVYCSNPPNCGNITLSQNYSAAATASFPKCQGLESRFITIQAADSGQAATTKSSFSVPLCYTGEPIYEVNTKLPFQLPGIVVEFSRVNPGESPNQNLKAFGVVEVAFQGRPIRSVTMDLWQVKSLVLSQYLVNRYNKLESQTPFAEATQYEGKRPTWRASLLIQSSRFVDAQVTTQSTNMQAVWVVTGSCGLVFQFWLLCSLLTYPLRKIFPGPAQKAVEQWEKEEEENGEEGTDVMNASSSANKKFTAADSGEVAYKEME